MKTFLHQARRMVYLAAVLLTFTFAQLPARAAGNNSSRDSILINKLLTSKKYKIKIYPGATHEVLFFNASGEEGKVYQFFLFDIEGNMVKQTQIRNKQTTILTNFNKGCYTFEVFSDDEHIENGTLTIK
jgi:hypothetical protein